MTTQIRRNAFETNSSSSHSITISAGEYIPDKLPVFDGVCEIHPGEFGWGYDSHHDAATKAAYCLTFVKERHPDREMQEQILRSVIQRVTGATEVRFVPEFTAETKGKFDFYEWGYIDHQSQDVCEEAFESEDLLERFIFNPRSVLVIDNDNH